MKKLIGTIVMLSCILMLFGCGKWITINPSTDVNAYETLGRDVGTYLKATKDQEWLAESKEWADNALLLTDEELIAGNVLQVAYEKLLAKYPEKADKFLLAKSILTILGVQINLDISTLLPEDKPKYIECARGLLKGYSEALN